MKQETFFFRFETLAPLHIGCGEDYEPTNFAVKKEQGELVIFAPLEFISRLNHEEKEEFSRICSQGTIASLLDIFKFMQRHAAKAEGRSVQVCSGFLDHYDSTLRLSGQKEWKLRKELNQFRIERTAFQPLTGQPYIPGSSIKGALRTALLDLRQPSRLVPVDLRDRRASGKLEKKIFDGGSFATDPMRLVKVSDFIAEGEPETRIVYAVSKKKKISNFEPSAPYQIMEVVKPGSSFIGSITIVQPDGERGDMPTKPVTMLELEKAMWHFFQRENERENRELDAVGIVGVEIPGENEKLPLRVGRHSGAESLTIEGYRNIKIMQGRGNPPKNEDHATTIWLAADHKKAEQSTSLKPFGWLVATSLSAGEVADLKQREEELRDGEKMKLKELAKQRRIAEQEHHEQERLAAEAEKRRQVEKAAQEAREAAEREQWESLTDNEKDIQIVRGGLLAQKFAPEKVKDPIQHIWPKIDTADPVQKKALAQAFKDLWVKSGKWKVNKKKKKQFEKVKKVKEIIAG